MSVVFVHDLGAAHQKERFSKFLPLSAEMRRAVDAGVKAIFDAAGGSTLLKASGNVYLKPNGIDARPYCYTRPELVEAVVRYWFQAGAKQVYLFENSTQSNATRLVFEAAGYTALCRRTGAKPVYLDEDKTQSFVFKGKPLRTGASGADASGPSPGYYEQASFELPRFVVQNLIEDQDKNLYISLPKLKTHSMAGVTLGIKNQWAFPRHNDRRPDHNFNLAHKLADVLDFVRPDFTLIEGVEGTIYGHYPATALADSCVIPFGVLIGSANVVAADLAGAKVFGLDADDAPHLKIALERGYGGDVRNFEDITIVGDLSKYTKRYPSDLFDSFPPGVRLVKGKKLLCKEGCLNNPLSLLQMLWLDYGGKEGWTLVMGKGHDPDEIDRIEGRVLIAGRCAVSETSERLIRRLGRRRVYLSGHCNDLAATIAAMFHLMRVNPAKLVSLPAWKSALLLLKSKLHGSTANVPSPLSHIFKTV